MYQNPIALLPVLHYCIQSTVQTVVSDIISNKSQNVKKLPAKNCLSKIRISFKIS